MSEYHGILLDLEFKNKNFIKQFEVIGQKKSETNPWFMIKVKVPEEKIEEVVKKCQENLSEDEPYYCHFYRDDEVIVVFKNKIFRVTPEKITWKPVIEYGLSLNIPIEQLDMKPCRFEDETY
jgi:hypothetical protein